MKAVLGVKLKRILISTWICVIPILSWSFNYSRGRLFDAFENEKSEHKANSEDDSDEEPEPYLNYVNNLLHSQFSNSEVSMAYNVNGFYPHKAQISSDFNLSALSNKIILARNGCSFEEYTDALDMHPFTDRANALGTGIIFLFYGRLTVDLLTCKKFSTTKCLSLNLFNSS